MLPKAQNAPTEFPKFTIYSTIPCLVLCELFEPKIAACGWEGGVLRATVPETSIDENDQPFAGKCEIWGSRQRNMASPSLDPRPAKQPCEPLLGGLVSTSSDSRHDL